MPASSSRARLTVSGQPIQTAPLLLFIKPSMRIVTAFVSLVRPEVCAKTAPAKKTAVSSIAVSFLVIYTSPFSLSLCNLKVGDEIQEPNESERQNRHYP